MEKDKVYVLDTNIILQNLQNIKNLSDNGSNIVVIPETVLLELEDKKKLPNELGFYSREFARFLASTKIKEIDLKQNYKVVKLYKDNIIVHIIQRTVTKRKSSSTTSQRATTRGLSRLPKSQKSTTEAKKLYFYLSTSMQELSPCLKI